MSEMKMTADRVAELLDKRDACQRPSDAELLARIPAQPKPGQVWRHNASGGLYSIVAVGLDEATLVPVVTYFGLESGVTWTRPVAEFLGTVADDFGNKVARYREVI